MGKAAESLGVLQVFQFLHSVFTHKASLQFLRYHFKWVQETSRKLHLRTYAWKRNLKATEFHRCVNLLPVLWPWDKHSYVERVLAANHPRGPHASVLQSSLIHRPARSSLASVLGASPEQPTSHPGASEVFFSSDMLCNT